MRPLDLQSYVLLTDLWSPAKSAVTIPTSENPDQTASVFSPFLQAFVRVLSVNTVLYYMYHIYAKYSGPMATHFFFSKNISIYVVFNDQNFNDTLTNDIVSFEQLGLGI